MEPPVHHPDHKDLTPIDAQRITAESMPHHLPGTPRVVPLLPQMQDVMVQLFSHHSTVEPILVPAVVEPLLVLVLAGMARVEERSLGGEWKAVKVQAGDFFLTNTSEPYEMRWQTTGCDTFEVMHLYLGLPLIDRAARDLLGEHTAAVTFLDISGAQDERVNFMLNQLRFELIEERKPSLLFVNSLAQALTVHLIRRYLDPHSTVRRGNALQAYKLRRVIDAMNEHLADDFRLADLAHIADLSEYHFSRIFKRATGLSPSQYFIRLRMSRARHLLRETDRSIIDVGLEVGYSSPSHFSQVFRREVGVTPSAYRQA
ncbi:AraC family transcriptional regulator [Pseudomonas sp. YuFO20]|uniref:helix-turn-helix domain-containing protein n=1 Tax=unclassified Pseudomonas TaxID=196821 RepID=UPI002B242E26|nr:MULTISPECIES: helix-turn-helix domain-containing protein [unclassified Pseudomonas]MEB2518790.1 AraC family transcriptional regulator [Pseudomonas sp. YuFO20]MEB2623056.1 AraC family transcriptional regulator [Pseudomonas sp. YuFO8]